MLENVDTHTYGDKKPDHVIRYCVDKIFENYFKNEQVTVQAQMLKCLLSLRKLKKLWHYWVFENQPKIIKKWKFFLKKGQKV